MRIFAVLLLGVSLLGCADERESVNETDSAIVVDNKLSANKLSANKLSANKLSANKLSANKLSANRLELNMEGAEDLIQTAEGREVLAFIISCAVKDTQTLVAEFGGETFEFFGELGLANRWLDRRLDRKGAGWVSACLFSRVNAANVAIPVSLRGPHRLLTVTTEEAETWSLQEGAFYGNYFTPDNKPIDWIACRGSDQATSEVGGLVERDCAEPDPANPGRTLCGFKFAGDCGDFADRYACKRFSEQGTFYKKCASNARFGRNHKPSKPSSGGHDDDDDDGHDDDDDDDHDDDDDGHDHHDDDNCGWNRHRTYREVITTYVVEP